MAKSTAVRRHPAEGNAGLAKATNYRVFGPFWQALGEFAHLFSQAELSVTLTLRDMTLMPDPIAKIVMAGMNLDARMTCLRQLVDLLRPQSSRALLKHLLDQLSLIAKMRNDILHYGTGEFFYKRLVISNALVAKDRGRIRRYPISVDILEDVTWDLRCIITGLDHVLPYSRKGYAEWKRLHGGAWRYKQPALMSARRRHPKTPPAPPPPQ